jgi:tryptophan-rich sensory protein
MRSHYVPAFAAVALTAFASSRFTSHGVNTKWFQCVRPRLTPHAVVFPVVWTVLYALIAVSLAKAMQANDQYIVFVFGINLVYNVIWCYLYFKNKRLDIALLAMFMIIASTVQIIRLTNDINVKNYMTIYLIWLAFAALLNIMSIQNLPSCNNITE